MQRRRAEYYKGKSLFTQVSADAFRQLLRWIKERYNNPKIFISESGYGDSGAMDDQDRITFFQVTDSFVVLRSALCINIAKNVSLTCLLAKLFRFKSYNNRK